MTTDNVNGMAGTEEISDTVVLYSESTGDYTEDDVGFVLFFLT